MHSRSRVSPNYPGPRTVPERLAEHFGSRFTAPILAEHFGSRSLLRFLPNSSAHGSLPRFLPTPLAHGFYYPRSLNVPVCTALTQFTVFPRRLSFIMLPRLSYGRSRDPVPQQFKVLGPVGSSTLRGP
ncbi:Uncharacterized protein APZ42_001936 [Daphnia magna]|uniref:Uncharacterized protein n=1 Tax=Daphnia magna TaxID=35525 RepID=A0A164IMN5_9CRUS|nr:Uncharacterized protein APZ42_001936 [Daphnia magna]